MNTLRTILRPLAILFVLACTLLPARADVPSEASRLRILLVIDSQGADADINGFALDKVTMKKILKEALREQNLEDRYTLDILDGADVTPTRVLAYYRNLKVEATEALLCYYSGHGAADETQGHFFDMRAGRLLRSELRKAMEAKRSRLVVLLSDCCGAYGFDPFAVPKNRISLEPPSKDKTESKTRQRADQGARQNTLKSVRGETLRHLLFQHRGVVDITACDVGKLAFSSRGRGGYFTLTLTHLLGVDGDRFDADAAGVIGWNGFFNV
ncbi:MAG TPA: caspase family protein, partial [Gemmataceae bacterium]|nr:caspase family protein [Gemmataceae bacterium]